MQLLLRTMRRHFPRLNARAYTFADVERLAKRHKVSIRFAPYPPDILGYFCVDRRGRKHTKHIVINDRLGEIMRCFVALHEIAHFFLHSPKRSQDYFYCRAMAAATEHKHDCEANAFALVAMVPLNLLIDLSTKDFDEIGEMLPICIERQRLYETYGI